jgi:hypothetical protein
MKEKIIRKHINIIQIYFTIILLIAINIGIPIRVRHKENPYSDDYYIEYYY